MLIQPQTPVRSWLPALLRISDEDLVDMVGFDAYVFLRLLQLASKWEPGCARSFA